MNPRKNRIAPVLMTGVVGLLAAAAAMAAAPAAPASAASTVDQNGPTILQTYKGHFLIGTSADAPGGFSDQELKLIKENFNVITPENYMKPGPVHPLEDVWSFKRPDALVAWCAANGIAVHGHCLIWHSQTGGWFFQGATRDILIQRMKDHIMTLVGRYKGKIHSWDVVNEAINDGGGGGGRGGAAAGGDPAENLRGSQWLNIIGPDFLTMAFKFAHEADPDAKLFYNDYNIESGAKHTNSMALLRRLIKDGAPIYGVGIQGHWSTSGLPYAALDKSIADYASLGLKVSISELDITIAGATGGQLNNNGGGRRGGPADNVPPATAPGAAPGAGFLMNDEPLFFTAAPAGPAAPGGAGRGGFGGGGAGRGGGRGGAQPPVNPATTILTAVPDLTDDQKARITAISPEFAAKLAAWQKSSQGALLAVQPQYTPGQVAYQHELEESNAEQAVQNGLRDAILNDAEVQLVAILTPAQAQTWEASRLNTQVLTQFGALSLTDAEKTKVDAIVTETAAKLAAAKDQAGVADAKEEFPRKVLDVLDDTQVSEYKAQTLPAAGRGGGRGRGGGGGGGNAPSAAGLKAQADAYARVFAIFEKHKETMDRVTIWGLNDARSWRAPQSAVVLDANNLRKPAYVAIVEQLLHPDPALAAPE